MAVVRISPGAATAHTPFQSMTEARPKFRTNPPAQSDKMKKTMDDQEFQRQAGAALEALHRRLTEASENADFEPDFNAGALTIEFEDPPAKFVVSPNSPVHQIWLSAQSKSFKFAWDAARAAFTLPETGETLDEVIAAAISRQLGVAIEL